MVIPLQFPASSESGNYDVFGKLDETKAYPGGIDVTGYLPQTQFMGSVEYIAPADEPPTIAYSPSGFSFAATEGGANPPSQILRIWNSGHIANIDMGLTSTWWGWRTYATATVSIADAQGNPVAGATLSGHWEGATPDTDSGETDSQGRVKLSSNAVWKASGTRFTFTVDNVTKGGWTYQPEANIEITDSIVKESNGFFSRIWLLLKSFIQRLGSMFSEVIKL